MKFNFIRKCKLFNDVGFTGIKCEHVREINISEIPGFDDNDLLEYSYICGNFEKCPYQSEPKELEK